MANLNLQDMSVEQLEAIIEQAQDLVKTKRKESREKAIEEARAILEKAGVDPQELTRKAVRVTGKKRTALKQGGRYVNPANRDQVYTAGRGRPPKWVTALQAKGEMPEPQ